VAAFASFLREAGVNVDATDGGTGAGDAGDLPEQPTIDYRQNFGLGEWGFLVTPGTSSLKPTVTTVTCSAPGQPTRSKRVGYGAAWLTGLTVGVRYRCVATTTNAAGSTPSTSVTILGNW
jgi:hypothetical protein